MSWYDEMVAAGRSKSRTTGNVRCGVAAVHEVLGSLALETPVNCHSELMVGLLDFLQQNTGDFCLSVTFVKDMMLFHVYVFVCSVWLLPEVNWVL